MFACLHLPGIADVQMLVELASHFSPSIEIAGRQTVIFSIDGLERLIGSPRQIASEIARMGAERNIHAHLAIASNPDAALHAARHFPGVTLIPGGHEARMLGGIPLSELSLPVEMQETLHSWGIRTFHEFALLPPLGIVERFGAEGLRLQDQARGCFRRPLVVDRDAVQFERSMELEHRLDNLQPLLFVVNSMLTDLCKEMRVHGVAANELRLRLELEKRPTEERTISFATPMRESNAILKLLQLQLDANPPPAAILGVTLTLVPVEPRMAQNGLFCATVPEPVSLAFTLARICGIVGAENAGSAELLDTHRPDAFLIRQFALTGDSPGQAIPPAPHGNEKVQLVLRPYRPALSARVIVERGYPRRVAAAGISGNVTNYAGPWRASGDWWTQGSWARDEWDVSLSDGGLYRIYRSDGWFVAGEYD